MLFNGNQYLLNGNKFDIQIIICNLLESWINLPRHQSLKIFNRQLN